MSDIAIKVRGLGKKYYIGERMPQRTLTDSLKTAVKFPYRLAKGILSGKGMETREEFWALDDVSFDVKQGEVLGIIGRNGAGKSTLLKILSRIVAPTRGEIEMTGRVGSLLEVGTGFHPELTGRENIYFNGSLLGMTKAEVTRKFDEIVDFSGVEKFIDTPVKFYSSGMYTRLAFAVAAHLEPEILIVDEVLAVGDAEFQKKCLGKMDSIAKSGRTVLFVSHNMSAVEQLCQNCIALSKGSIAERGGVEKVVSFYSDRYIDLSYDAVLDKFPRVGGEELKLVRCSMLDENSKIANSILAGDTLRLRFSLNIKKDFIEKNFDFTIAFDSVLHGRVLILSSSLLGKVFVAESNNMDIYVEVPNLMLMPGQYSCNFFFDSNGSILDWLQEAFFIEVLPPKWLKYSELQKISKASVITKYEMELL